MSKCWRIWYDLKYAGAKRRLSELFKDDTIRTDERRKVWAEAAEMVREWAKSYRPDDHYTADQVDKLADAMAAKGAE